MTRQSSKLNQRQHEELQTEQSRQVVREFATPEELLRFDVTQTPVPPTVADRLRQSLAAEPQRTRSWWQRLFNKL